MCHINLVYLKNNKTLNKSDKTFLKFVLLYSYIKNPDGWGFYNGSYFKSKDVKDIYNLKIKDLLKNGFALTHFRLATNGALNIRNVQPFLSKDLVLVHNGVLPFYDLEKSDSFILFEKLNEKYKTNKDIYQIVRSILDKTTGTFSIVIYEKKKKTFYYVKNTGTTINLFEYENFYLLSTKDYSLIYNPLKKIFIKDYVFYEIDFKKSVFLEKGTLLESGMPKENLGDYKYFNNKYNPFFF